MLRRRLLAVLSMLSLILCVGTVGLWVRSYWYDDAVSSPAGDDRSYEAESERGEVVVVRWLASVPDCWSVTSERLPVGMGSWWGPQRTYGLRTGRIEFSIAGALTSAPFADGRFIVISDWLLILVTGILPAVWLRRLWFQRRRNRVGCCPGCGYNLTGNTSGICPECGTPVQQKHSAPM